MSTEKKQESWVSIAQRCPLQNSPVTAANIAQMEIPFKVYLDDQMQWRNAHTKLVIVDVAWWLEALPEFPLTSFPVSNPMQLISELNDKLLEHQRTIRSQAETILALQGYEEAYNRLVGDAEKKDEQ